MMMNLWADMEQTENYSCMDKRKNRMFMRLFMVGIMGFEPVTSSSLTKRATKLRHIPFSFNTLSLIRKDRKHFQSLCVLAIIS